MTERFGFALTIIAAMLASTALAQAKGPAFTDAEKAGSDYALQGEYSGELDADGEKEKFGVQVIAQGQGKFRVVGWHGGLPGDGWNGEDPVRVEDEFEAKDGVLTVKDKHGVGVIKGGVMTVDLGDDGTINGTLKRIDRKSPTLGKMPPDGAVVLYAEKSDADKWENGRVSEDGYLMQGITSKQKFGSHQLHVEFRLPFMPEDRGQGRGNSGLYVQGRYEVQMLDSFGLEGKHNECGGIYSVKDPDVNMCFPPLAWQTYDVDYTAAKFDENGKLVANPRITVHHNGVLIHKDVELPGDRSTTAAPSKPGPEKGPVYLQDHGNPVVYRNIWVFEKD